MRYLKRGHQIIITVISMQRLLIVNLNNLEQIAFLFNVGMNCGQAQSNSLCYMLQLEDTGGDQSCLCLKSLIFKVEHFKDASLSTCAFSREGVRVISHSETQENKHFPLNTEGVYCYLINTSSTRNEPFRLNKGGILFGLNIHQKKKVIIINQCAAPQNS